jgi:sugar lactone lactonase YvrE
MKALPISKSCWRALLLPACGAPIAAALLLASVARAQSDYATPYTFTTFAGTAGVSGSANGTGAAAQFQFPDGIAVDGSGNVFVTDGICDHTGAIGDTIRKVSPSGVVTTLAGATGVAGSADGTGAAAQFDNPWGVAVDGGGNLYIGDTGNNTIRMVTPAGVVTTLAGAKAAGSTDGTGAAARFNMPLGVALDGNGNLYVADSGNNTIRKVTPAGVVTTFAGTAGKAGSADGTGAAARFNSPVGIAIDGKGNLYVADGDNCTIRKVTPAGVVTTLAGTAGTVGNADGAGAAAQFYLPSGIAVDGSGNLYIADTENYLIRMITPSGVVTTLAGTTPPGGANGSNGGSADGTGAAAQFFYPSGIAVDGSGNLYVGDSFNYTIRKGYATTGAPQVTTQPADLYVAAGGNATFSVSASGSSALSYQWNFNSSPIPGATASSYTVSNVQASDAGPYTVTVTDADGSSTSNVANLYVNTGASGARLINISTRAMVGTGGNILIPGFVIGGSGTETLLIRGDGPSLTQFGVAGVLAQPILTLLSGQTVVATNTGWGTSTNPTPAQIASVATQVGAFPFASGSNDSALVVSLSPGAYTVQISGVNNTTGVALAEIYEVASTGTTRLINIATRAQVGTGGNILIPGFVIGGTGFEQVLVRGDGPSLTAFGVSGALAVPVLSVLSGQTVVASNTGWGTSTTPSPAQIASVASAVGAFPFTSGSADCAQVVNLTPGAYTIEISGQNNAIGVALAEVYEVP